MKSPFTHVLLTRFNVAASYFKWNAGIEADWLDTRFDLFETYCLKSVMRQRAPFRWLVLFDHRTPRVYRGRIAGYAKELPAFEAVFVHGDLTNDRIQHLVRDVVDAASEFLITTRLDNDDAIADDFLARVQRASRESTREFLNFPHGIQLKGARVYHTIDLSNPFLSCVERLNPATTPQTVYCGEHSEFRGSGAMRQIWGPPTWLQVIHGRNVANRVRGIRRFSKGSPRGFHLPSTDSGESLPARLLDVIDSSSVVGRAVCRRAVRAIPARSRP